MINEHKSCNQLLIASSLIKSESVQFFFIHKWYHLSETLCERIHYDFLVINI